MDDPSEASLVDEEEAVDLLEEYWFFGNLLPTKATMLRCFSDPFPSVGGIQEMPTQNDTSSSSSSAGKTVDSEEEDDVSDRADPFRTPLVPRGGRREEAELQVGGTDSMPETQAQTSAGSPCRIRGGGRGGGGASPERECDPSLSRPLLLRAPSLPPFIGREQSFDDGGGYPRMSRSSRQGSLNLSNILPPRPTSKGLMRSPSMSKCQLPRIADAERSTIDFNKEMRRRYLTRSNSKKNMSELEDEEVKGFKELGFSFDQKDLNPKLVSILPGLEEKSRETKEHDKVERPYLSEEWLAQSYAPMIPKWNNKGSPEDVKAHIKFWARVVASNVR